MTGGWCSNTWSEGLQEKMDHETKVRVLKQIVDEASFRIMKGELTKSEGEALLERVRNQAKLLLPEQMERFELIYKSRLTRLIEQFAHQDTLA